MRRSLGLVIGSSIWRLGGSARKEYIGPLGVLLVYMYNKRHGTRETGHIHCEGA